MLWPGIGVKNRPQAINKNAKPHFGSPGFIGRGGYRESVDRPTGFNRFEIKEVAGFCIKVTGCIFDSLRMTRYVIRRRTGSNLNHYGLPGMA